MVRTKYILLSFFVFLIFILISCGGGNSGGNNVVSIPEINLAEILNEYVNLVGIGTNPSALMDDNNPLQISRGNSFEFTVKKAEGVVYNVLFNDEEIIGDVGETLYTFSINLNNIQTGVYSVSITASNSDSSSINSRESITVELWISVANPTPVVEKASGPDDGETITEDNATFSWSGTDQSSNRSIAKYQFRKDGGSWEDNSPVTGTTYDWSGIGEGSHTFSVKAIDDESAESNVVTWEFNYEPVAQGPRLLMEDKTIETNEATKISISGVDLGLVRMVELKLHFDTDYLQSETGSANDYELVGPLSGAMSMPAELSDGNWTITVAVQNPVLIENEEIIRLKIKAKTSAGNTQINFESDSIIRDDSGDEITEVNFDDVSQITIE